MFAFRVVLCGVNLKLDDCLSLNFKIIILEMPFFYHKFLNNMERREVDIISNWDCAMN